MLMAFIRPMARANRYIQNVPLNYVHLAAWLRDHGHQSKILDHVLSDVDNDVVDAFIRDNNVRVAGIGCMTCELAQAVEEAKPRKKNPPGIKVVSGGPHQSGHPVKSLKTAPVDYVIDGPRFEAFHGITAWMGAAEHHFN